MKKYEENMKQFLKIRDILLKNGEDFVLAKAFKKPVKWYGEHDTSEALKILRAEVNA